MIHYAPLNTLVNKFAASTKTIRSLLDLNVGTAPKEEIFRTHKMRLYHYQSTQKPKVRTPVLITYALVNRYYMIDLDEKRSLVRRLLNEGLDLYLIDWGYPDPADRYIDLDDYINGYMYDAVQQVKLHSDSSVVNILGICQGGVFSTCYSALHPKDIKNLVTMVAPFDFHTEDNTLGKMAQHIDAYAAHQTLGNFNGDLLNAKFAMLNPISLSFIKYLKAMGSLQEEEKAKFFLRMEKWINDSPDQAGATLAEFVTKFYQQNLLKKGKLSIGAQQVDLKQLTHPILNIFGTKDHIVPPAASQALGTLVGSKNYTELSLPTGHIGMYVGGKSAEIPPKISAWLQEHSA